MYRKYKRALQKYTHHGVGWALDSNNGRFLIFRTVSNALHFLWFGEVLSSVSCLGCF